MYIDWDRRLKQKGINENVKEYFLRIKKEKTYSQIAEFFGVSEGHICSLFKQKGISPGKGSKIYKKLCRSHIEKIGENEIKNMTIDDISKKIKIHKKTIYKSLKKLNWEYKKGTYKKAGYSRVREKLEKLGEEKIKKMTKKEIAFEIDEHYNNVRRSLIQIGIKSMNGRSIEKNKLF